MSHAQARPLARRRRDLAPGRARCRRRWSSRCSGWPSRSSARALHAPRPGRRRRACPAAPSTTRCAWPSGWRRWRRARSPASRSWSRRRRGSTLVEQLARRARPLPRQPVPRRRRRRPAGVPREARAALLLTARRLAVTSATGHAPSRSYNRRAVEHRIGLVVLQTLTAACAKRSSRARWCAGSPTARCSSARGAPAEEWCGVRPGRGARELGLALRQAGHADLRRAGHLVRRHRALRRHAAHPRRLRARRRPRCWCVRKADFKKLLAQHVELYEALLRLQLPAPAPAVRPVEDLNTLPLRRAWPSRSCCWRAATASQQGDEIRIGLQLAQEEWPSCSAPRASASTRS